MRMLCSITKHSAPAVGAANHKKHPLCVPSPHTRWSSAQPWVASPQHHQQHHHPVTLLRASAPEVMEIATPKQFSEHVDHGNGLIIIHYGAEWCGPCKLVEPIFFKSALTFGSKAKFSHLDCSKFDKTYLSSLNVKLLPTFQAFKDGSFVDEFVGARPNELAAWIKRVTTSKAGK